MITLWVLVIIFSRVAIVEEATVKFKNAVGRTTTFLHHHHLLRHLLRYLPPSPLPGVALREGSGLTATTAVVSSPPLHLHHHRVEVALFKVRPPPPPPPPR
jgi:hypothetical protein